MEMLWLNTSGQQIGFQHQFKEFFLLGFFNLWLLDFDHFVGKVSDIPIQMSHEFAEDYSEV
jgi:hypothetical protein